MKTNEYKKSFIFILLMMTVFFNWVLPKAGTKISGIPLTIGILLFGIIDFILDNKNDK